mgnify:CR=1 FL=1
MVAFYLFQRLAHAFYLSRGFGFDKQQGNAVNEKDNVLPDGSLAIGKPELVRYMKGVAVDIAAVSYTHLRAHETPEHLVCRLLLEQKKK